MIDNENNYYAEIKFSNQNNPSDEQYLLLVCSKPLTKFDRLECRNGVYGYVRKSKEVMFSGGENEQWAMQLDTNRKSQFYISLKDGEKPYNNFVDDFFCDRFKRTTQGGTIEKGFVRDGSYKGFAPVFKPNDEVDTLQKWIETIQTFPLKVLYKTKEETFEPLPEDEQQKMRQLHTYTGNTGVAMYSGGIPAELSGVYRRFR